MTSIAVCDSILILLTTFLTLWCWTSGDTGSFFLLPCGIALSSFSYAKSKSTFPNVKILNNVTIKLIESLKRKNSSTLRINAFRMKRYIWNKTSSFCPIPCHLWGLLSRATELTGPSPEFNSILLFLSSELTSCTRIWQLNELPSSLLLSLLLSVSEVSPPVSPLRVPPPQLPWPSVSILLFFLF